MANEIKEDLLYLPLRGRWVRYMHRPVAGWIGHIEDEGGNVVARLDETGVMHSTRNLKE